MRFSRQGYWSGLPFPSPGDLLNPGIEPGGLLHCRQTLYRLSYKGSWYKPDTKNEILYDSTYMRYLGKFIETKSTLPCVYKEVEQLKFSYLVGLTVKWYTVAIWGIYLAVVTKAKYMLNLWPVSTVSSWVIITLIITTIRNLRNVQVHNFLELIREQRLKCYQLAPNLRRSEHMQTEARCELIWVRCTRIS